MTAPEKLSLSFTSPFGDEMRDYINLKRSLGAKYRTEEGTLADFDRFLRSEAALSAATLTQDMVQRWLAAMTCGPVTLVHKARLLHRFFDHLVSRGVMPRNPACRVHLRPPATKLFQPYIFSKEEVAAILEAAGKLHAYRRFPLRPKTVHTVLAILYGLGLRLGEACRLQVSDLDLGRSVLSIRDTKFHKARLVPFGPRLKTCLARYVNRRQTIFPPLRRDDPLFVASGRCCLSQQAMRRAFRTLLEVERINPHGPRQPRLHDLRHSFAVHRLLRWYREGVHVQSRLSHLSTFMGHIDIKSTQVYLTVTTELLDEANARFHTRFGSLLEEANS